MVLDKIIFHKKEEIEQLKKERPLSLLLDLLKQVEPPRPFAEALLKPEPSIIAEIKRYSPSRGPIWEDLDPSELAKCYEKVGVSAISVLTDNRFFHGSLEDLNLAHHAVSIPCLRKEFVIDEYQLYETRVFNADTVLLIVRILSDEQIKDFLSLSRQLGMEPLVEVHNEREVEKAIRAGAKIIGINNRDLDLLTMNIETTTRLKKIIPNDYIVVSESGISHPETIRQFFELGIQAFLIGESILQSKKPEQFIPWLLGKGKYEG
ncbi:MAG: indole-3-glycerol phosphate synthase TrpC [Candidatus Hydrogenedens sp.]|nr:indole-3-glycerol phosphate synthase TrpC [Candidatus Hydrogenedens sp.]